MLRSSNSWDDFNSCEPSVNFSNLQNTEVYIVGFSWAFETLRGASRDLGSGAPRLVYQLMVALDLLVAWTDRSETILQLSISQQIYKLIQVAIFRPFSCAMLARIVVHVSLFSCLMAIRDDAMVHASLKQEAVTITNSMSRTVPLEVNAAIRKVNGRLSRKMMLCSALGSGMIWIQNMGERNSWK